MASLGDKDGSHIDNLLRLIKKNFENGNLEGACSACLEILASDPNHFDALHSYAVLSAKLGKVRESLEIFSQAISISNTDPTIFNNQGIVLSQLGQHDQAVLSFDRATYLDPNYAEAFYNKGNSFYILRDFERALNCYDKALQINPGLPAAHNNRGNAYFSMGKLSEALKDFEFAISLNPLFADAYGNSGNVLSRMRSFDRAIDAYTRAIELNSENPKNFYNRGNAFFELRRYSEALNDFGSAIKLNPNYAEAYCNLGVVQQHCNDYKNALINFDRSLHCRANFPEAWNNRGNILARLKFYNDASLSFQQARQINPDFPFLLGEILHSDAQSCHWDDLPKHIELLVSAVLEGKPASIPFAPLALIDSPDLHLKIASLWLEHKIPYPPSLGDIAQRPRGEKIHVAYISSDYYDHATSHLISELFELHDRTQFEVTALSIGLAKNDQVTSRIISAVDRFAEVGDKSDTEVAKFCRQIGVDIAIDLKGYTKDSRPGIFAERCAPVQMSWLGYPGTSASKYIDYIIADPIVIGEEDSKFYTENIIWMPYCYQANDRKRRISTKKFRREDCNLPKDAIVLCCFNNSYKILPETFDSWARILAGVPSSILWLLDDNPLASDNLRKEALSRGVDPARLVFAERLPVGEHLARHELADLFLDTWPYNAHTTASDALWAGLPLITRSGRSFASRVAGSLLTAVGLDDLITHSTESYENLAISLLADPSRLAGIKRRLRSNVDSFPLFDSLGFTRSLEKAYTYAYEIFSMGKSPSNIKIEPVEYSHSKVDAFCSFDNKPPGVDGGKVRQHIQVGGRRVPTKFEIDAVQTAYRTGNLLLARKRASKLTRTYPKHPFGWKALGTFLQQSNDLLSAEKCFLKCLEFSPEDPEAFNNLGITYENLGRLEDAERSYVKAIELNPKSPDFLNNLADIYVKLGRFQEARGLSSRALAIKPGFFRAHCTIGVISRELKDFTAAQYHLKMAIQIDSKSAIAFNLLGSLMRDMGDYHAAEKAYREAISLVPDFSAAHANLALILKQFGDLEAAQFHCEESIRLNPQFAPAHNNLANVFLALEMFEKAEISCRNAICLDPSMAQAHNNLGYVLHSLGRYDEAVASLGEAIKLKPDFAEAHSNLGRTLWELGQYRDAKVSLDIAIKLSPGLFEAHNNQGVLFRDMGLLSESETSCRKALDLRPDSLEAMNNLGNTLRDLGRPEEAELLFMRAIAVSPLSALSHSNLSNALRDQGRLVEALASSQRAVELEPDSGEANTNLAINSLLSGNFLEGFKYFEYRWSGAQELKGRARNFSKPIWLNGQSLIDKKILLHAEQGLGDTIQFCRYAREVKALGASVILEVQPALVPLMAGIEGVDELIARGQPLPEFDFHCPLMSLPLAFQTDQKSIPSLVPYLSPRIDLAQYWQRLLGNDGFKVGICWGASKSDRCIPPELFANLSKVGGVRLLSLQQQDHNAQIEDFHLGSVIQTFGTDLDRDGAFLDTSAIMANCDLIITTDTSIAHLAGAIGAPVWIVLGSVPDWRWMLSRADSPWYPTARLFRQTKRGDWLGVMREVQSSLAQLLQRK